MTKQLHPITPPPKLVEQWFDNSPIDRGLTLATQAARWGSDQELEACCRWIEDQLCMPPDARADVITQLNGSRRPTPPSLKEQALEAMSRCDNEIWCEEMEFDLAIIRTALESLPS